VIGSGFFGLKFRSLGGGAVESFGKRGGFPFSLKRSDRGAFVINAGENMDFFNGQHGVLSS
jgi:hypothetical protein